MMLVVVYSGRAACIDSRYMYDIVHACTVHDHCVCVCVNVSSRLVVFEVLSFVDCPGTLSPCSLSLSVFLLV